MPSLLYLRMQQFCLCGLKCARNTHLSQVHLIHAGVKKYTKGLLWVDSVKYASAWTQCSFITFSLPRPSQPELLASLNWGLQNKDGFSYPDSYRLRLTDLDTRSRVIMYMSIINQEENINYLNYSKRHPASICWGIFLQVFPKQNYTRTLFSNLFLQINKILYKIL